MDVKISDRGKQWNDGECHSAASDLVLPKALPQLLARIELDAAGSTISFAYTARKCSYRVKFGTASATEARCHFVATTFQIEDDLMRTYAFHGNANSHPALPVKTMAQHDAEPN